MYNIEVKDNNNYFANNILVHNCDDGNDPSGESQAAIDSVNTWWSQKMFNRVNDARTAVRIMVHQRSQSEDDLSGNIINNERVCKRFKKLFNRS